MKGKRCKRACFLGVLFVAFLAAELVVGLSHWNRVMAKEGSGYQEGADRTGAAVIEESGLWYSEMDGPVELGKPDEIDLLEEATCNHVPLLYQWDERWSDETYAGGKIENTGCGPTCLSMVALYLTGDQSYSPSYIAKTAEKEGYAVKGYGSSWELMGKGCELFGLKASELILDENAMMDALAFGHPIICAMGKGDFTEQGHFIVITGYLGGFLVNDPNSSERSERVWSYREIKNQIKNLWFFEALT